MTNAAYNVWLDLHYFPIVPYIQEISGASAVYISLDKFYQKKSYQTRCYIRTDKGIHRLTVPTKHPHNRVPYNQIKIDYATPWHLSQWRTITTSYNTTPYGLTLLEIFYDFFKKKPIFLVDLSLPLLKKTLEFLKISTPIHFLRSDDKPPTPYLDLQGAFHPRLSLPDSSKKTIIYTQRFEPFIPNLSIIDFIACEGLNWGEKNKE